MKQQWYSIPEVAARVGLTRQTVHRKVQEGIIPCDKSLGVRCWRIPAAWCENPAGYTQVSTVVAPLPSITKTNKKDGAARARREGRG